MNIKQNTTPKREKGEQNTMNKYHKEDTHATEATTNPLPLTA